MKFLPILPLLATALASHAALHHAHLAALLDARAIDPTTMDPVRLSVLSVLRTAMPTADAPLPTGAQEPEWYQKLPADVKALLPSLYPAKAEVAATSTSAVLSSSAAASLSSSVVVTSTAVASQEPFSSVVMETSSLGVPTPTASANATVPSATRILNGTLATATVPPVLPSPSGLFSAGARNAVGMGAVTALVWLGVGAGFVVFA